MATLGATSDEGLIQQNGHSGNYANVGNVEDVPAEIPDMKMKEIGDRAVDDAISHVGESGPYDNRQCSHCRHPVRLTDPAPQDDRNDQGQGDEEALLMGAQEAIGNSGVPGEN